MSDGEIHAWHFVTGKPVQLQFRGGLISRIETVSEPPPNAQWVAPGLFDLQVNGYAGVDFQQDDLTTDSLLVAARGLRKAGCTRFFVTLVTDDWSRLMERLRHFRSIRTRSLELTTAIAGWHIEGPFLSAEPGFHGAHDPQWMLDPTPDHIKELRATAGDDPVLLTLAPERRGAIEAIKAA